MKQQFIFFRILFCFCFIGLLFKPLQAQQNDCTFKNPLIHIHFGKGNVQDINASPLPNYRRVNDPCPTDGHYTFTHSIPGCFFGDWFKLTEDHTPGEGGNMMIVNASPEGGVFFKYTINGLKGNTIYELAAWLMNICRIGGGCPPLPPDITMRLTTPSGKYINEFHTGLLAQTDAPHWTRYNGLFTMPAGETTLILTMLDVTTGGCGNDFALDDITIRECIKPNPPVRIIPKTVTTLPKKQPVMVKKPEVKNEPVKQPSVKTTIRKMPVIKTEKDSPVHSVPELKRQAAPSVPAPLILRTRANPLIKQIETGAGEIKVDLYDNGIVDGDTVSVYHNNEMIVSRMMLSEKPISFRIMVDAGHPHHELIMIANNLGSIPPNTALMIVTTKDKKYEVFISTTEQTNAKVVIDLKE